MAEARPHVAHQIILASAREALRSLLHNMPTAPLRDRVGCGASGLNAKIAVPNEAAARTAAPGEIRRSGEGYN